MIVQHSEVSSISSLRSAMIQVPCDGPHRSCQGPFTAFLSAIRPSRFVAIGKTGSRSHSWTAYRKIVRGTDTSKFRRSALPGPTWTSPKTSAPSRPLHVVCLPVICENGHAQSGWPGRHFCMRCNGSVNFHDPWRDNNLFGTAAHPWGK